MSFTAVFSCRAQGYPAITGYQWYQSPSTLIVDATSRILTLEGITFADDGNQYFCRVTNAKGTTDTDTATLTVINNDPPVFTLQPISVNAFEADNVSFEVLATHVDSYQWYHDDVLLVGETAVTLDITGVTSSDLGVYNCIATNTNGDTSSNYAGLTFACPLTDPYSRGTDLVNLSTFPFKAVATSPIIYSFVNHQIADPGSTVIVMNFTMRSTNLYGVSGAYKEFGIGIGAYADFYHCQAPAQTSGVINNGAWFSNALFGFFHQWSGSDFTTNSFHNLSYDTTYTGTITITTYAAVLGFYDVDVRTEIPSEGIDDLSILPACMEEGPAVLSIGMGYRDWNLDTFVADAAAWDAATLFRVDSITGIP